MKTSVLIPTYNSARTIETTLESVFSQTAFPHEILVMDDGSTDDTVQLLNRYLPRITIFQQRNQGVAQARNALCERATGDLLAFLDHDDIWHPDYLAAQQKLVNMHPKGVAFFTGHNNFRGYGNYEWKDAPTTLPAAVDVIASLDFIKRFNKAPGPFTSMSYCCIPRTVLNQLGKNPFCAEVSGCDDVMLYHRLVLLGPIVYNPSTLAAYRITSGAQSASLIKAVEKAVRALELLKPLYKEQPDMQLRKTFNDVFSSQLREYGKVLMGAGRPADARGQILLSLKHGSNPKSRMKSLALLFLTRAPNRLQPRWPSEWKISHSEPCEPCL